MITSNRNARIVNVRKLSQRKHRHRQNRFLVEGLQLLSMAVEQAQRIPQELFYCEAQFAGETAPRLLNIIQKLNTQTIPVSERVMQSLSERELAQGMVATFAPTEIEYSLERLLALPPALLLIIDRLQDPGNLGTLIRTADAVGATGVLLLEPCVDPFDPKTVRGTMGSLFTIPFARTESLGPALSEVARRGYRLVGADGRGTPVWESQALHDAPVALVLGNEARGLSEALQPYLSHTVSLPLRGHAESLNVAVAGGTLMYEWLRVNRP